MDAESSSTEKILCESSEKHKVSGVFMYSSSRYVADIGGVEYKSKRLKPNSPYEYDTSALPRDVGLTFAPGDAPWQQQERIREMFSNNFRFQHRKRNTSRLLSVQGERSPRILGCPGIQLSLASIKTPQRD